jgi:hypothetical protein
MTIHNDHSYTLIDNNNTQTITGSPTTYILDKLYREIRSLIVATDNSTDNAETKLRRKTYTTYVNYDPTSFDLTNTRNIVVPDHFQHIKESEDELLNFIHGVAGGGILQQAQADHDASATTPAATGSTRTFQENVYIATSRCMVAMEISDPEAKKAAFRELFSEMVIHSRQTQGP